MSQLVQAGQQWKGRIGQDDERAEETGNMV